MSPLFSDWERAANYDDNAINHSGSAILLGLHDSHRNLADGVRPVSEEQSAAANRLWTDMDAEDYASPVIARADTPGLDGIHSGIEKRNDRAFLNTAAQNGRVRGGMRGKITPILLSLAVHAAVTWDAQSTNHFFHHYPEGYRPTEVDPLMRPFAGKALMYPMANLFFAVPVDLLLFKTRRSRMPIRVLTYAAASYWVGMEMHQSILNRGNEHIGGGK